jgi:LysR family transcriptional activator of glutamate synthase operon
VPEIPVSERAFDERQVDFHDLEIFLEFSRTEHLGRTAEVLGYSIASIQRAVRSLESRFGVALVERQGRRIRLLHAGRVLADQAAQVLRSRSQAIDAVLTAGGRRQTKLRLGHNFSHGVDLAPVLVGMVLERHPDTQFYLESGPTNPLIAALLAGHLDAAVVSPLPIEPDLEAIPLYSEPSLLIVGAADVLAGRERIELAEVRDRAFVALADGAGSRQALLQLCARAGFTPRITVEVSDMFAVEGVVSAGVAISVVPARIAARGRPAIVGIPLAGIAMRSRTVGLTVLRGVTEGVALAALRDAARRYAAAQRR